MDNVGAQFDAKLAQVEMSIIGYFSVPEVKRYIEALNYFAKLKASGIPSDSKDYVNAFNAVEQLGELPQVAEYLRTFKLHAKLMQIKRDIIKTLNITEELSRK